MKPAEAKVVLEWNRIVAYGAPGVGAGYMYLLLTLYVMKFATDVLLIAPAVMGTIFGFSRIWDAISDPVAGYLSDRTINKLGRRRIWMLISIVPIAISFVMVFSPPISMEGTQLSLWMAFAIICFYSAMTVFMVPHMSLGAELTPNYHERSRQASGFMPNQEQPFDVQMAIVSLYGLFPLVCYAIGAWLFTRFTLDEAEYARIRLALDHVERR